VHCRQLLVPLARTAAASGQVRGETMSSARLCRSAPFVALLALFVIVPALQDPEIIKQKFPKGYKALRLYLRMTPQPNQ